MNKKLIFAITFLFLFSISSFSQIGVSYFAGINYNPNWNHSSLVGNYSIGSNISYKIKDDFFLSTSFSYSKSGIKNELFNVGGLEQIFRLGYFKFKLGTAYNINQKIGINIAGYYSLKLSEERNINSEGWKNYDLELFSPNDFGISSALGWKLKYFGIQIGYNFGINELIDFEITNANGEPIDSKIFNRYLSLGIGVTLSKKKS